MADKIIDFTQPTSDKFEPNMNRDRLSQETEIAVILSAVKCELERAIERHGPMHSAHEAFGVIFEEFMIEFVKEMHSNDIVRQRKEMIQVAAMACRFLLDVREEV